MNRDIKVSYPKRRTQTKQNKLQSIQPPVRKNMYEVVIENFRISKRVTFLHRIIYVGEHNFPPNGEMLKQSFSSSISIVNDSECLERLSGFLLYYHRYFVHLVEGDEDSLNHHIGILLTNEKFKTHLKAMKLLIHVSHIKKKRLRYQRSVLAWPGGMERFIKDWNYYSGIPSKLLCELDTNCSLEDSGRQVFNCIRKVYATVTLFVENNYPSESQSMKASLGMLQESASSRFGEDTTSNRLSSRMSNLSLRSSSMAGPSSPYRSTLPEIEVLNFIISSNFTQTLSDYYSKYGVVPQRDIYKDKVWPVPSDFVPYDIFTKVYENITELPKPTPKIYRTETTIEEKENNGVGAEGLEPDIHK